MFNDFLFQAFQIANLIREYCEVLAGPQQDVKRQHQQVHQQTLNRKRSTNAQNGNSRPASILHKNAAIIEPQPS